MKRLIREHWYTAILVAFVLTVGVLLWRGYRACEAAGGTYVRGLFWMECIK
jgi:hypothetical protein